MAQLSDDCFAFDGPLMPLDQALARISRTVLPIGEVESVPLAGAVGRYLADDIVSSCDVPPYSNSAVDGYAVRFDDLSPDRPTRLKIAGRVAAGHPLSGDFEPGTAARIFTGAPMPDGPDTVMMQEDCKEEGGFVEIAPGIKRGANLRVRGEDVSEGQVVLRKGRLLDPAAVGLAATSGASEIKVYRKLRVAVMSTGDEVVDPAHGPLDPGRLYDANRYTLMAAVSQLGCDALDLGIIPDNPGLIGDALDRAVREGVDVILTSGGMSVGEEDHVRDAVSVRGRVDFWRLAIKPGRPVGLGLIGNGEKRIPVIGLPGNTVAVFTTFAMVAVPLLKRLSGGVDLSPRRIRVVADFDYCKKGGRREFVRARFSDEGGMTVVRSGKGGAGILSSVVAADGFVELKEDTTYLNSGDTVDFIPFGEVLK